jgi:hypothetical protein
VSSPNGTPIGSYRLVIHHLTVLFSSYSIDLKDIKETLALIRQFWVDLQSFFWYKGFIWSFLLPLFLFFLVVDLNTGSLLLLSSVSFDD